ncbi:MAG: hypothetical protein PGN13_01450 [Patulibacter minatonensis]
MLDNCEHLIEPAAVLADELLARCPKLRIVATSREPLAIAGEHLAPVGPLSLPEPDAAPGDALTHAAVRLFADRAAAADPGFSVTTATAPAVIEICRRLDGQPLAIELAAARLRSLPVDQIAARLDDRFRLLTGGSRAALPRQRTLRAVVDWSWDLLTDAERTLARRLAIFPAGVTEESASAVGADGGGVDRRDVADLLAALVDRSLLVLVGGGPTEERDGPPRYRMLETIREYGTERLDEAGELEAIRTAHAHHFAELVEEADPRLRSSDQLPWFWLLRAERENVLAALRWLVDSGDAERATRLAVSLVWFWALSGSPNDALAGLRLAMTAEGEADPLDRFIAEAVVEITDDRNAQLDLRELGRRLLEGLIPLDASRRPLVSVALPMLAWLADEPEQAEVLLAAGSEHPDAWVRAAIPLARAQWAENAGDVEGMREHFTAALEAFRAIGDRWGTTAALNGLGGIAMLDADLERAEELLTEASELLSEFDATDERSMLRLRLADLAYRRGDIEAALRFARSASDGADLSSPEWAMAGAGLSRVLWSAGEHDEARTVIDSALATLDETSDLERPGIGHMHALVKGAASMIALDDGRAAEAADHLTGAYPAAVGSQDHPIVALIGVAVAALALHHDRPRDAAEILGAAAGLRGAEDPTNTDIARLTTRLREALGAPAFAAAFEDGRGLARADAIARIDPATVPRAR